MKPEMKEALDAVLERVRNMSNEEFLAELDACKDGAVSYAFSGMRGPTPYQLISQFYGDRCAERSKVPLINHIDEGMIILESICASQAAKDAYCLHPMLQGDKELRENFDRVMALVDDPYVIALAMEYRSVANEFLSEKVGLVIGPDQIRLSVLPEVNAMLIADKVQNRKDFITYHRGTHPRSEALDLYFQLWMKRLGITEDVYLGLCQEIDKC